MNTQNSELPNDKRALSFLLLFKMLKSKIKSELEKENKLVNDCYINQLCAETAKDLLSDCDYIPTQEELSIRIKRLKVKLLSQ